MLRSCFLSSFVEFYSAVSEEKLKMSQQILGQGGHFVFPINLKNTKSVEGVEILLPIKFRRIPFSGFRRSRKCLSQSEARAAILFIPDWPEKKKHKRGRRHSELASCQVSLNSVQRFLQRSRKCFSQSEAKAAICFFRSPRKTQTW